MSDLAILRELVRSELARRPGITVARVDAVAADGSADVNLHGGVDNTTARPMGTTAAAPGDRMLAVHLQGSGAPLLWQRLPIDCGSAPA